MTHGPLRPRARVAVAEAWRDAADYATACVPTTGDRHIAAGEHIALARRLRVLALEVLDRSVMLALADGATWEEVADAYGLDEQTMRVRYGAAWKAYVDHDDPTPWRPTLDGVEVSWPSEPSNADPRIVARQLDDWCARHIDADAATSRADLDRQVSRDLY